MDFTVEKSIEVLERTPGVLDAMLRNIATDWTSKTREEKHGVRMKLSDTSSIVKKPTGL